AYEVLGVDEDASRAEIEAARRNLVKVLHPDRPGGDAARMSLVNAAADILLDTAKRADYDAYLADSRPRRTAPRGAPTTTRSTAAPAPRRPARPESAAEPADAADYEADEYDPIDYEPTPARRRGSRTGSPRTSGPRTGSSRTGSPRTGGLFGRTRRRPDALDP